MKREISAAIGCNEHHNYGKSSSKRRKMMQLFFKIQKPQLGIILFLLIAIPLKWKIQSWSKWNQHIIQIPFHNWVCWNSKFFNLFLLFLSIHIRLLRLTSSITTWRSSALIHRRQKRSRKYYWHLKPQHFLNSFFATRISSFLTASNWVTGTALNVEQRWELWMFSREREAIFRSQQRDCFFRRWTYLYRDLIWPHVTLDIRHNIKEVILFIIYDTRTERLFHKSTVYTRLDPEYIRR